MTLLRIEKERNGDHWTPVRYYSCNKCGKEIYEGFPHVVVDDETHCCDDCSFILGLITEERYLRHSGIGLSNARASVYEDKAVIWVGKRPPWQRTNKDIRNSAHYAQWRTKVFERDQFTCQHCNQVGGELNAHHIKPFAEYEDLRFDVSNGLTLCVICHREEHKLKR